MHFIGRYVIIKAKELKEPVDLLNLEALTLKSI